MCVNDVLVTGAEPFMFLDYFATGSLDVDMAERVIKGIAHGCELAGCALVGGETAEMPGFYQAKDYDLAGFCVGVVEREEIVTGAAIEIGDSLIGLASTGPHSNGYSLIRRIVDDAGIDPDAKLLDQLMAPTRIYAKSILALQETLQIRGMAHITGGGLVENLPRMFADRPLAALIDMDAWPRPDVFNWLQQAGNVDEREMLRTFNCGVGFILCVAEADVEQACQRLAELGERAFPMGKIVPPDAVADGQQLLISA
jgi:phosphoribosylformylglycinamidine cyclo-ligase